MDETQRRIARARLGDVSATYELVDSLRDTIGAVTAGCVSARCPLSDVLDVIASAVLIAIETFEYQSTLSFADYATDCMVRAVRERVAQHGDAN